MLTDKVAKEIQREKQPINEREAEIIRNMCDLDMNVSAVEENVYLHRNTAIYHLQKIAEKNRTESAEVLRLGEAESNGG